MIELLCSATVLPVTEEQRFIIRYPLLFLFCVPAAIISLRTSLLWRGGFRDYLLYLGWGGVTITYSLLPGYSLARVTAAVLIFVLTIKLVSEVKDRNDMLNACLKWFLIGLGVVWIGLLATLVAVPHDLAWDDELLGMVRFRGFFGSPNQVGEVTLATVGAAQSSGTMRRGGRRSGWVWKWRWRSRLGRWLIRARHSWVSRSARLALRALAIPVACRTDLPGGRGADVRHRDPGGARLLHARRGLDPDRAHRRVEIRGQKIEERPLLGWGFEVEGEILQSKYFPIWWGPWEEGPHSSLHNGYLSRAVGLAFRRGFLDLFLPAAMVLAVSPAR